VRARLGDRPAAVALTGVANDRPHLVVAVSEPARALGVKAGALVKAATPHLGGGGGGRDDLAQGGGTRPDGVTAAHDQVEADIRRVAAATG
jgi:alanyl-tRNA synthetase